MGLGWGKGLPNRQTHPVPRPLSRSVCHSVCRPYLWVRNVSKHPPGGQQLHFRLQVSSPQLASPFLTLPYRTSPYRILSYLLSVAASPARLFLPVGTVSSLLHLLCSPARERSESVAPTAATSTSGCHSTLHALPPLPPRPRCACVVSSNSIRLLPRLPLVLLLSLVPLLPLLSLLPLLTLPPLQVVVDAALRESHSRRLGWRLVPALQGWACRGLPLTGAAFVQLSCGDGGDAEGGEVRVGMERVGWGWTGEMGRSENGDGME